MSKKKAKHVEDTRTKIEIEIDNTCLEVSKTELYISQCKEALNDLATHTTKIKQLENDIGPKEAEHKAVLSTFHKTMESGASIRNRNGNGDEAANTTVGSAAGSARPSSRMSNKTAAGDHDGLAPLSPEQEARDREALKILQHVIRDNMQSVIVPIFNHPKTQLEQNIEKQKEMEKEAKAAAEAAAAGLAAPPSPARPASSAAKKPGAAKNAPPPLKTDGPDFELLCPPGIEQSFFEEILKLRNQRLTSEAKLSSIQAQLTNSRQIVVKRRDEGYTKTTLKKAEKRLVVLNKSLADLRKIKEHEDAMKAEAEAKKATEKAEKKGKK